MVLSQRQSVFLMKLFPFVSALLLATGPTNAQNESDNAPAVSSFEQLIALLESDAVRHQSLPDSETVLIPVKRGPIRDAMVIRWANTDGVIHFAQSMGITVSEADAAPINAALVRLNHVIPFPGLGRHPATGIIYFRMTIPTAPQGGLTNAQVRAYFSHTLSEAAQLQPAIKAVHGGSVAPEDVVKFITQRGKNNKSVPLGTFTVSKSGSNWVLVFEDKSTVRVLRDGEEVLESTFAAQDAKIRFIDRTGSMKTNEPGVYDWRLEDDVLVFDVVHDNFGRRKNLLTGADWKRDE